MQRWEDGTYRFSHNAELEIIDDYYFLGTPVLKFRNAGYEQIRIDYRIYYKGDGVTSQFIQYIRQNKDLRDELNGEIYRKGQLQAEIEAEKRHLHTGKKNSRKRENRSSFWRKSWSGCASVRLCVWQIKCSM